jgi:hypothetical protein
MLQVGATGIEEEEYSAQRTYSGVGTVKVGASKRVSK